MTFETPFFTPAISLWVDGTEYVFLSGYGDDAGTRVDTYVNASAGTVTLQGTDSIPNYAEVTLSYFGSVEAGFFYGDDSFQTFTHLVSIYPPEDPGDPGDPGDPEILYGPDALWVRGRFYARLPESNDFLAGVNGDSLTASSADEGATISIVGQDSLGTFEGAVVSGQTDVFMLTDPQSGALIPAIPANSNGTVLLSSDPPPEGLPPAVSLGSSASTIGVYLGMGPNQAGGGADVAFYGPSTVAEGAVVSQWLLKIHADGSGMVIHTDYSTEAGVHAQGTYSTETHLFQTAGPATGFPQAVVAVDPNGNHSLWEHPAPDGGLPSSFIVRGQPWRYAGMDGTHALYQGYYSGQQMRVGAADVQGGRVVTLTDPLHNQGSSTSGALSAVRGSVRLRDGTLAVSGNDLGNAVAVPVADSFQQHTIAADLDIVGNNLSFGVVPEDASIAGALFNFAGDSGQATLHSILARPQARWGWWRTQTASVTGAGTLHPVMWLDEDHKLKLYPADSATVPSIVLDTSGPSSFKHPVRVAPGGDIPMGAYQQGDPP